jgi:hypothetical protein
MFAVFLAARSREAEKKISRTAHQVVTGSSTEAVRLKEMGCPKVTVIPMVIGAFPEIDLEGQPSPDVRVVHLGSLETTANREGLSAYLSKAHAQALKLCAGGGTSVELLVVGDTSRLKSPLRELLLQENIVLAGYVPDLTFVLRPYDIAILPYTHDSGYRTKLPLLMGHAQVTVATRAAVAGSLMPGLESACILLERVEQFPEKIAWLSAHPEERVQLGRASYAFCHKQLSMSAVAPRYGQLVSQMVAFK